MKLSIQTLGLALCCAATASQAEVSESCKALLSGQRLTIAVPNSAGGGYDTYARALAPVIETYSGVTARVANMPSGGGLAARSFVMNSGPDDLAVLIENVADLVTSRMENVGRGAQAEKEFMIDGYSVVGIVHSEPSTWLGRAGIDLLDPDLTTLVASEGALDEALIPFFVTGRAMGLTIDVVTGYDGTREMVAAILRGEADISGMSATTSFSRAEDEGIDVLMMMSDGPAAEAPDLPYLAGEGSVVWQRTEGLPPEEATYRRDLATAVAGLRGSARGLFVSTNLSEDRRDCIASVMDQALFDAAFTETAVSQGRPVQAQTSAEAVAFIDGIRQAYQDVLPTLEVIAAEYLGTE